jgi:6-phosphogluconolactonase (cycloisomerase 2 family)
MKKNLSALCFAGLVALTGLVATGCGSSDASFVNTGTGSNIREYAVIANSAGPSLSVKGVSLVDGTSSLLNNQFTTGVGINPLIVKTHPNINVVYVLNNGSNTISQYTMDGNGGLSFQGTVATPATPTLLVIHPSGGFVYVVGGAANAPGTIRRFNVNGNGLLSNGTDVMTTTANYTNDATFAKDADFSFGGGTLHVPCLGFIESYPVNADGSLGTVVQSAQTAAPTGNVGDNVRDIDVRPGQASLVASVRTVNGNDKLRSYTVTNGALSNVLQTDPGDLTLGMGDFSSNGQYYVGSTVANRMFGFNVDNSTGTLSALGTNPMAITGTGAASPNLFVNLDPSNLFILSTPGTAANLLTARYRSQSGDFVGSTIDGQGLNTPQGFDYFNFNF